ncbi:MAG: nicotinate-nucleotide adenylyltransferase [Chloroflexota bacterium]|nr:nicotinate-nucleotide adenylyltransferase [Chloroflexota bacterium]
MLISPPRAIRRMETTIQEELATSETTAAGRIGILGGTFDPPHIGHLWLATLAADALNLDRILFMPAAQPPNKRQQRLTRATDRLLMTRLAITGEPRFGLTMIEMERPGPSHTIDSVEQLQASYPDAQLFLVMAADSLRQIDTWREPDRLLSMIEWAVGPRPGTEMPTEEGLRERFGPAAGRIHLLVGPSLDVSSSQIRERVAGGHAIRYLVPRAIEELIASRRLYRPRGR